MWHLIGVDGDGTRHRCNQCRTEEEAKTMLAEAMPKLEKMKAPYIDSLIQAQKDEEEGLNEGLYYSDYMGWKEQGFFIVHFELEYREDDY